MIGLACLMLAEDLLHVTSNQNQLVLLKTRGGWAQNKSFCWFLRKRFGAEEYFFEKDDNCCLNFLYTH